MNRKKLPVSIRRHPGAMDSEKHEENARDTDDDISHANPDAGRVHVFQLSRWSSLRRRGSSFVEQALILLLGLLDFAFFLQFFLLHQGASVQAHQVTFHDLKKAENMTCRAA